MKSPSDSMNIKAKIHSVDRVVTDKKLVVEIPLTNKEFVHLVNKIDSYPSYEPIDFKFITTDPHDTFTFQINKR